MFIEISDGEVLDKLSILHIKLSKIIDPAKLENIKNEYSHLTGLCASILESENIKKLYTKLYDINLGLWEIEDKIRIKEKLSEFDDEFIKLARLVYQTNDKRAQIKKQINLDNKSLFVEEKSYESY
jgi:hypothetical protein